MALAHPWRCRVNIQMVLGAESVASSLLAMPPEPLGSFGRLHPPEPGGIVYRASGHTGMYGELVRCFLGCVLGGNMVKFAADLLGQS